MILKTKSGTTIDTDKVYTLQVYTAKGYLSLLAGSEAECRLMCNLLRPNDGVYKLKMIDPKGIISVLFI